MIDEDIELHSFTVSVDYEIVCCTEEEAAEFYESGTAYIVHIEDNGEI